MKDRDRVSGDVVIEEVTDVFFRALPAEYIQSTMLLKITNKIFFQVQRKKIGFAALNHTFSSSVKFRTAASNLPYI